MRVTSEQVADAIESRTAALGYPPTVRELCDALGLKSTSTIAYHLDRLEALGVLAPRGGKNRTLTVARAGRPAPACCPTCGRAN